MTRAMRTWMIAIALLSIGCTKKEPAATTETPTSAVKGEAEKPPFGEMTVEEVDQRLAKNDGRTFVFDANPQEVFEKRHVPGAVFVPDEGVTASLLPADKTATLVFYCANEH
jgi:hypothetical protein